MQGINIIILVGTVGSNRNLSCVFTAAITIRPNTVAEVKATIGAEVEVEAEAGVKVGVAAMTTAEAGVEAEVGAGTGGTETGIGNGSESVNEIEIVNASVNVSVTGTVDAIETVIGITIARGIVTANVSGIETASVTGIRVDPRKRASTSTGNNCSKRQFVFRFDPNRVGPKAVLILIIVKNY